jgi:lantibiotic modifying enzyme
MTVNLTESMHSLISNTIITPTTCKKFLASDGISSNNLLLKNQKGKVLLNCKNVNALKGKIDGIGISFAIIKNLDEYQFLLCKYIPTLPDYDVFKLKFQKIRLLIVMFIDKIVEVLLELKINSKVLADLNKHGNAILLEASELTQEFRERGEEEGAKYILNQKKMDMLNLKIDYFIKFNTTEIEVNSVLLSIYGHDIKESEVE